MHKFQRKFWAITLKLSFWQPWPYVAYTRKDNNPISWWFYSRVPDCELFYQLNWLGNKWVNFWLALSRIFLTRKS